MSLNSCRVHMPSKHWSQVFVCCGIVIFPRPHQVQDWIKAVFGLWRMSERDLCPIHRGSFSVFFEIQGKEERKDL